MVKSCRTYGKQSKSISFVFFFFQFYKLRHLSCYVTLHVAKLARYSCRPAKNDKWQIVDYILLPVCFAKWSHVKKSVWKVWSFLVELSPWKLVYFWEMLLSIQYDNNILSNCSVTQCDDAHDFFAENVNIIIQKLMKNIVRMLYE